MSGSAESGDELERHRHLRKVASVSGIALSGFCAAAAAIALLLILGYIVANGARAINLSFLTQLPHPVGVRGGGVANGIVGSAIIVGLATAMALPIGVFTGIYLALFGRNAFAEGVRFLADVLSGVPSIAVGLFAYTLLVAPFRRFSAVSASFAFAILMLPILIRTSEEAVRTVPRSLIEGALALGMTTYRSTMHIVLPVARPAIITGLLLAIARITGETAPLLFTAFGSQFWELNPRNPMAELSLQVFTYAISPYRSWQEQAWGGALLLVLAVFALNLLARIILRPGVKRAR
jgi:phosphate transport system permease protein